MTTIKRLPKSDIKIVYNELSFYIDRLQAIKTIEENRKISIIEIEENIANYTSLSVSAIQQIKRGSSNGTLKTGLLLHEYLKTNLDESIEFTDLYSFE